MARKSSEASRIQFSRDPEVSVAEAAAGSTGQVGVDSVAVGEGRMQAALMVDEGAAG